MLATEKIQAIHRELLSVHNIMCDTYDTLKKCQEDNSDLSREELKLLHTRLSSGARSPVALSFLSVEFYRLNLWFEGICTSGITSIEIAVKECKEYVDYFDKLLACFNAGAIISKLTTDTTIHCKCGGKCKHHCNTK